MTLVAYGLIKPLHLSIVEVPSRQQSAVGWLPARVQGQGYPFRNGGGRRGTLTALLPVLPFRLLL